MADETYQGWKNRETWIVNLWLNNDQGLYTHVMDNITKYHPLRRAEFIESYAKGLIEDRVMTGFISDLLNASLARVDWQEIVDGFMEA